MECQYCQKTFSGIASLKHHQRTAQYCLAKQGKPIQVSRCEYCNKIASSALGLRRHIKNCKKKRLNDHTQDKYIVIAKQKLENKKLKEENENLKERLATINKEKGKLEDKLDNILITAVNKPTTTINKPTTINNQRYQQVMNLTPLTLEHLTEQSEKYLGIEHIKDGGAGYGRAAAKVFDDCSICADFSRKKLMYRTEDGKIINDPGLNKVSPLFFKSIIKRHDELAHEYKDEQYRKYGIHEDCTEEEKNAYTDGEKYVVIGHVSEIMHMNNKIKQFAKGEGMDDATINLFRHVLCSLLSK